MINSADFLFTIDADGSCVTVDDRGDLDLTQENTPAGDFGTCPFAYSTLASCTLNPPGATFGALNAALQTASEAACAAVCASDHCQEFAMDLAGPVPPGLGCCAQARGGCCDYYPFFISLLLALRTAERENGTTNSLLAPSHPPSRPTVVSLRK